MQDSGPLPLAGERAYHRILTNRTLVLTTDEQRQEHPDLARRESGMSRLQAEVHRMIQDEARAIIDRCDEATLFAFLVAAGGASVRIPELPHAHLEEAQT